ncbi:glycosyltransferase [Pantoea sp.]|uniref:glycosyltransferase n=1 Tax=Pantoea sp. TaxID=69393 RepID=UPI0028AF7DC8|nr:glycosyltransferase [Pantoea sp.]
MSAINRNLAILLASRNGESFLAEQLASFADQSFSNWNLYISDDGSNDATITISEDFLKSFDGRGFVTSGPQNGLCENFKFLIGHAAISADYYAFSDQDDIWLPDKLQRAVDYLGQFPEHLPSLYCSRTKLINEQGTPIGFSPLNEKKPSFQNALLQNIASGNTMVFNQAARNLFIKVIDQPMIIHDWTLYLIVTACGGSVFYDKTPGVLYRQHSHNVIGNGMGFSRRVSNYWKSIHGKNRHWNNVNMRMLEAISNCITPENHESYSAFYNIRGRTLAQRIALFKRSQAYHQHLIGQLTNFSYALFDKL